MRKRTVLLLVPLLSLVALSPAQTARNATASRRLTPHTGSVCATQSGPAYCPVLTVDGNASTGAGTDNAPALNAAITAALALNPPVNILQLPAGNIKVNSCINLTNRPSIQLRGAGEAPSNGFPATNTQATILIGNTGGCVIDTTGSSNHHISDLTVAMRNGYRNPSIVGILQGRDNRGGGGVNNPFCYDASFHIERVSVLTDSSSSINAGHGYIGIANAGAENGSYDNLLLYANTPLYAAPGNPGNILSSPYQTLASGCPNAATDWSLNKSTLITAVARGSNGIYSDSTIGSVGGIGLYQVTWIGNGGGGTNTNYNIFFHQATSHWKCVACSTEQNVGPSNIIGFDAMLDNMDFDWAVDSYRQDSGPILQPLGNNLTIQNSELDFFSFGSKAPQLFGNSFTGESCSGCFIRWEAGEAINASNWTLNQSILQTPALKDGQVTVGRNSTYFWQNASDQRFVNGLVVVNGMTLLNRGLATPGVTINGDTTMSAGTPEGSFCTFINGNLAAGTYGLFHPRKAVTFVSLDVSVATPPAGCSSSPTLSIGSLSVTLANGAFTDSSSGAQNESGGASVQIGSSPGSGCSTPPANINICAGYISQ